MLFCFLVMFVPIRQPVREQPDTGYWKSLLPYFSTDPGVGGGDVAEWLGLCFFVCGGMVSLWLCLGFW